MNLLPRFIPQLAVLCLALLLPVAVFADDWRPVEPAEIALKTPVVEKDADAEALFWEVRIDDSPDGDLILSHYIRIKVFTERGRESQSKIDIPFGEIYGFNVRIRDIAGRTIKPDGSFVQLKSADIFERTVVKATGVKWKAKSFAMPGIEPGSIIEYRWKEVRVNRSANYMKLDFQREIPVQRVKYLVKPYPFPGMTFRSIVLNGRPTPFTKESNGFYATSMTNMPAMHEEARMPPENQLKTWMLVYYDKDVKYDPDKYWLDYGKRVYEETKSLLKVNDAVRAAATSVVEGVTTDDEKIQKLFEFVRTNIKNVSDDASELTSEERSKLKSNKSPADTLSRKVGTSADIDLLFASLASALGFDARIVLAGDRGSMAFDKSVANAYFLEPSNIAVRIGDQWKFYNPGFNYVPLGMLRWQEEGVAGLITDPKQPVWVELPLSSEDKSLIKRTAKLKLTDEGVIEGEVFVEYHGHFAIEKKEEYDNESANEREESLREEVKSVLSTAEISDIRVENVTDQVKPLTYVYRIRVAGYAEKTGKRLFLQPAFFQYGAKPLFSASQRRYEVYFHYPWQELDEVTIDLPEGFALDNADAPQPLSGGPLTQYRTSVGVKDGRQLIYKRSFYFGKGGNLIFPVSSYPQLKQYFDMVNKQDNHKITLRQSAASAAK
jgi:hypothetical protein